MCLFTALGCETGDALNKIAEARTAYAQGDLERAAVLFEEILAAEPTNVSALVGLANIHVDQETLTEAGDIFDYQLTDRDGVDLWEASFGVVGMGSNPDFDLRVKGFGCFRQELQEHLLAARDFG